MKCNTKALIIRRAEAVRLLSEYRLLATACRNLEQKLPLLEVGEAQYRSCLEALGRSRQKKKAIEQAVQALDPALEQLLWYMYLDGLSRSIYQVADLLGLSQSALYRRRIKALDRFCLAYYGEPDSDGQTGC